MNAAEFSSQQVLRQQVFRHPIGGFERALRKAYDRLMRGLGFIPYTTHAQGARFLVDTTDLIDRELAINAIWEAPQLEDFAALCVSHRVDYFLDIGANAGVYSVLLAKKNLGGEIVAFEPDPGNRARLTANIAANHLQKKVLVVPNAVGDKDGEVMLMEAGRHNRGESWIAHPDKPPEEALGVATHVVRQIRFDDVFAIAGKIILVKMDVEGSEFHALAGMERTLRDNLCYLQVELYSDRFEELKALFARLGYRYLKTEYIDHYFTNMTDL
jgi:FkbM family methyltransferase